MVEKTLRVTAVAEGGGVRQIALSCDWPDIRPGESIAVNGCCLTIAKLTCPGPAGSVEFDIIPETLAKTNLGLLKPGDAVNVERSLRVGDRLDGHFVQGHIDGTAKLIRFDTSGDERRLRLQTSRELAEFLVPKGSVTLDGVSLTLAAVDGNEFEVALIPTTLSVTTLGRKATGWPFNLENDILTKTVVSWLKSSGLLSAGPGAK